MPLETACVAHTEVPQQADGSASPILDGIVQDLQMLINETESIAARCYNVADSILGPAA